MKIAKPFTGIIAFAIVLITMPLGHAVMILMDTIFGHDHLYFAAGILGTTGVILAVWGIRVKKDLLSTLSGLFSGLFIWTGWIEFSFVYFARRYDINPLMEHNVIVTKPEYLLMPSSIGFLSVILLYYLLASPTGCSFFSWWQKKLHISPFLTDKKTKRPKAIIVMMEVITILWTFYLVLLFVYDSSFFGDRHMATYIVAFGSLLWSGILFFRLLKINALGYAVRYAIPTVIIFWNFIEIIGRWGLMHEIWVEPMEHPYEMLLFFVVMLILIGYVLVNANRKPTAA